MSVRTVTDAPAESRQRAIEVGANESAREMLPVPVTHVVAGLRADHGGTSRSVPQLCEALAALGSDVRLVTSESGPGEPPALMPSREVKAWRAPRPRWPTGPRATAFAAAIADAAQGACVLHDHGVWLPTNHLAARSAQAAAIPRVVSPRGMLSGWALQHRGWRKLLAWHAYQKQDLQSAAVLHATSETEVGELRRLGLRQPVALVPNGIALPELVARPVVGADVRRRALFLSRVHPKKGVADLLTAWSKARPVNWELVIAGPGEADELARARRLIEELSIGGAVTVVGAVSDDAKWALYRSADLFVLPTHSENFGLVIGEALASEVPVITTTGAPWPWLRSEACGWWIEPTIPALTDAIVDATGREVEDLRQLGRRGRALVADHFAWATIARQMMAVYSWIAGTAQVQPPQIVT